MLKLHCKCQSGLCLVLRTVPFSCFTVKYLRIGGFALLQKKLNGTGFLLTAYVTDSIKKGELVWQQ
jgi:hypothetical protein